MAKKVTKLEAPVSPTVDSIDKWYDGILRMWQAWLISLLLLVAIYFLQPQRVGVLLYKTFFITWGAAMGYWIDRWLTPYDRPDADNTEAQLRRAYIVCAAMISFALAV